MRYRVLWIDDEFKKQEDFIGEAEQEGIDIYPFESHEEGIAKLIEETNLFHAVILDAKVKNRKDDVLTGLAGLTASRDRLIEINKNGYLPYFIFTGQPDYVDANWFLEAFGKYYIKAIDNEVLFKDLKNAIEKKVEFQIQKKYEKIFEICSGKYIDIAASKYLLDILIALEFEDENFNDDKYFNCVRKIIEYLFRASNKIGLLHDKCIPNGIVNLTWSSLFMAGKEAEIKPSNEKVWCSKTHFPFLLSNNLKSILDITSAASHTDDIEREKGRINISTYKKQINSNYLLYSLTFQVMDLLLWFKQYADDNSDKNKNKSFWLPLEKNGGDWKNGKVIKLEGKAFAFFKPDDYSPNTFIATSIVLENHLGNNDKVSVIIEEYEDIKTKEIKTRVKNLKKI